jgi:hypothetical protein
MPQEEVFRTRRQGTANRFQPNDYEWRLHICTNLLHASSLVREIFLCQAGFLTSLYLAKAELSFQMLSTLSETGLQLQQELA